MEYHFPPFSIAFLIAIIFTISSIHIVSQRRINPGSQEFILILFSLCIWSFGYMLEVGAVDVQSKLTWAKFEYLGIASFAPLWLFFCAKYADQNKFFSRAARILIWLIPAASIFLAFTNEKHWLLWSSIEIQKTPSFIIGLFAHGPWFYIHITYSYLLILIGTVLLLRSKGLQDFSKTKRSQVILILIMLAIGWIMNIVYVLDLNPIVGMDLTPISFTLIAVVLTWTIFRRQLFELVPIARNKVIENMVDGVIVLDHSDIVIDFNPAALAVIGYQGPNPVGMYVGDLFSSHTALLGSLKDKTNSFHEIEITKNPLRYLRIKTQLISSKESADIGKVITFHDITQFKQLQSMQSEQNKLSEALADQSRKLAGLYDLILLSGSTHQSQDLVKKSLKKIQETLGCQVVCFYKEDGGRLKLVSHYGLNAYPQQVLRTPSFSWMKPDQDVTVSIDNTDQPGFPEELSTVGFHSGAFKFIDIKGRALGLLACFWKTRHNFKVDEIALFSALTDELGIIIENAHLRQNTSDMATLQERRRLARDLHDSVTQSLHSLVYSADTAKKVLDSRPEKLPSLLEHLSSSALSALKEMRLLLYELRLVSNEDINMVEAIQTRLDAVEQRANTQADLLIDDGTEWPKTWEKELYPIVMEALNNSLKYAQASRVEVRLSGNSSHFVLSISDNGIGFMPEKTGRGGMGLINMAERADRMGGILKVSSTPHKGTSVSVCIDKIKS